MTLFILALLHQVTVAPEESGQSGNLLAPNGGLMFWTLVTFVILLAIKYTIGLRVSEEVEVEGLDINLHGEVVQA